MKNKLKILTLALLPMFLTGCSITYKDEFSLDALWTQMLFKFNQMFNNSIAGFRNLFTELAEDTFGIVMEYMEAFGPAMASIINAVTILAIVAIAVKFALSVVKNNMLETNDSISPDMTTIIKKICIALFMVWFLPYLCSTAFMTSSFLGAKVSNVVLKGDNGHWNVYDEMSKEGITFLTYCGEEAKKEHLFTSTDNMKSEKGNWEIITKEKAPEGGYSKWCDGKGVNVYESKFAEGKEYSDVLILKNGTGFAGFWSSLLTFVLFAVAWGVGLFSLAKRVVELVFLIATGWWYISSSLTDGRGESFGALFKKLTTICLTQFMFMFEMSIFASMSAVGTSLSGIVLMLAFVLIMLGTPTAIRELVQDTGTGGQALGLGKFVGQKTGLLK